MSTYGRGYLKDGYHTLPSSSPQESRLSEFSYGRGRGRGGGGGGGGFVDILPQNQNPIHMNNQNQTLEDAFGRLSVSHTPGFVGEGSGLIGFDNGYGYPPSNRSNVGLQKLGWYNNAGAMSSQNCWVGCGRDRDSDCYCFNNATSNASYLSGYAPAPPLVSQKEFQRFPSNGELLCSAFHGKFRGLVSNNRSNITGFNVNANGRRQRWLPQQTLPLSQRSIYDLRGKILLLAKDQCGCRVLQETMKTLTSQDEISFIFLELIHNVMELMLDPFGNYVFQKLVEICSEEQRTCIILIVTKPDFHLVNICLDIHGTRAVQKLLEHVTTQEQRSLIMSALSPGAVALTKDMNGLHVVEHCLKHFSNEDNKYLLNNVANNCFEIATDKSGCCVMQHCVDHAQGETKEQLMAEIIINASLLSEDCYGNYVVQHLVSLKIPRITESLLRQLEGKFFSLSCNKYGSNVVEKFFQDSGEQRSARIILELLHSPNVSMLLVDPFGNYVIKSAFLVSKGAIRNALVELVQLHSPMMRSNLYGQKLLDQFDRGKLRHM